MNVIVKQLGKNWSGKEFGNLPAKIYSNFDDAVEAINSYHFWEYDAAKSNWEKAEKSEKITFCVITSKKVEALVKAGKARW